MKTTRVHQLSPISNLATGKSRIPQPLSPVHSKNPDRRSATHKVLGDLLNDVSSAPLPSANIKILRDEVVNLQFSLSKFGRSSTDLPSSHEFWNNWQNFKSLLLAQLSSTDEQKLFTFCKDQTNKASEAFESLYSLMASFIPQRDIPSEKLVPLFAQALRHFDSDSGIEDLASFSNTVQIIHKIVISDISPIARRLSHIPKVASQYSFLRDCLSRVLATSKSIRSSHLEKQQLRASIDSADIVLQSFIKEASEPKKLKKTAVSPPQKVELSSRIPKQQRSKTPTPVSSHTQTSSTIEARNSVTKLNRLSPKMKSEKDIKKKPKAEIEIPKKPKIEATVPKKTKIEKTVATASQKPTFSMPILQKDIREIDVIEPPKEVESQKEALQKLNSEIEELQQQINDAEGRILEKNMNLTSISHAKLSDTIKQQIASVKHKICKVKQNKEFLGLTDLTSHLRSLKQTLEEGASQYEDEVGRLESINESLSDVQSLSPMTFQVDTEKQIREAQSLKEQLGASEISQLRVIRENILSSNDSVLSQMALETEEDALGVLQQFVSDNFVKEAFTESISTFKNQLGELKSEEESPIKQICERIKAKTKSLEKIERPNKGSATSESQSFFQWVQSNFVTQLKSVLTEESQALNSITKTIEDNCPENAKDHWDLGSNAADLYEKDFKIRSFISSTNQELSQMVKYFSLQSRSVEPQDEFASIKEHISSLKSIEESNPDDEGLMKEFDELSKENESLKRRLSKSM